MWYVIPHTKTKIISRAHVHTGTRAHGHTRRLSFWDVSIRNSLLSNNTIKSSTEKQSSAIIVHEPKRTATSTRTIHTRQNKPYRLGAAPAGVVGTPSRRCPAATVPAAVVFACGLGCCFAEIAKKKQNSLLLLYAAAVAEIA